MTTAGALIRYSAAPACFGGEQQLRPMVTRRLDGFAPAADGQLQLLAPQACSGRSCSDDVPDDETVGLRAGAALCR